MPPLELEGKKSLNGRRDGRGQRKDCRGAHSDAVLDVRKAPVLIVRNRSDEPLPEWSKDQRLPLEGSERETAPPRSFCPAPSRLFPVSSPGVGPLLLVCRYI
jgi:hypothetical protein